jgi:hypothetical protein
MLQKATFKSKYGRLSLRIMVEVMVGTSKMSDLAFLC